ncbi:MAG: protein kinase, partial [Acidobacteriota bacterium]|nr:protein kinase [Acidobacteriota bacterium]
MFREKQQIGLYILVRKLGKGGFGEVWLAERKSKFVTTKVAVKLPHDEQIDHETIKQEAQLWEQASGHPNILPIIDADEYDGQIVIVSEYAPDGSLDEWLKKNGKMSIERAVETTGKEDPKRFRVYVIVSRRHFIETNYSSVICAPVYTIYNNLLTKVSVGVDEGLKHDSSIRC